MELLLALLAQTATTTSLAPPAAESFSLKDLLIILASATTSVILFLLMRGGSKDDAAFGRVQQQIDHLRDDVVPDIQRALFQLESDVRDVKGLTEPLAQAIRLNIANLVPRSNPLREETNRAIIRWQMGEVVDPDILFEAAEEVMFEAREDPKLNEAERVSFSLTGAAMHYDATKMMTARGRQATP